MQNLISQKFQISESDSVASVETAFVETYARALHRYGLPSHRVEDALAKVSRRFGLDGQFFATPTAIFASLERDGVGRTLLIRVDPGEVNLTKLGELDGLLTEIVQGGVDAAQASRRVRAITDAPARYGPFLVTLGFAVSSAAASRFFGGGWREFVVCAIVGLLTGVLAVVAGRWRLRPFEPFAALVAGFGAAGAAALMPPTSHFVAMCGGLIVLIPGLTLTIGINELATRNLAAGTVRLTGALLLFLEIGFGVAIGLKLGKIVFGSLPLAEPAPLPGWTLVVAIILASISLTVLFQGRLRDVGWIAAGCTLAFAGARAGSQWLGVEMGALCGALLLGIASNLYARWRARPASVTLVPGLMLLVPGAVGFRSISSLLQSDVVSGMEAAFRMGVTGVALVTGLLIANTLLPSRRAM